MVRGGWLKQHPIENLQKEEDEISFIRAQNCCVCFVDIVNSIFPILLIILSGT